MNLGSIGVLVMHQPRCIAKGGFKINGLPKMGKGPMSQGNNLGMRGEASLPSPTQAGRIETCTELISKAMRCLENNDKDCIIKMLEELIKANCHNGNVVGGEMAGNVKGVFHELWLVSDNERRCELLRMLRDLGISKGWAEVALRMSTKALNKWLTKCGIDWEGRATRNEIVKQLENFLREKFGWDEIRMCEELWKFVGIDVNEFRRHGIEPCIWLIGLEGLRSLKRPYWLGLRASDLAVRRHEKGVELKLRTTNTIDAIFFPMLLNIVKTSRPEIEWGRIIPGTRHVTETIALSFYVDLGPNEWPWPIEFSANELERIIESFSDEELSMFLAGEIDGDGSVQYEGTAYVWITACKNCPKRVIDTLKEIIARRFGITGSIHQLGTDDALEFGGEKAVRLLRLITRYIHHPLKRLRAELILALYEGRISPKEFEKLYEMTKYEQGRDDIKRNRGLEALARAAPQTHTHGTKTIFQTQTENAKHRSGGPAGI
jgi:hypothetical protein